MAGSERALQYKKIPEEELTGLSGPERVVRIYAEDSYHEFMQEVAQTGSSFPLAVVNKIVEQDMVTGMRLYLEELHK